MKNDAKITNMEYSNEYGIHQLVEKNMLLSETRNKDKDQQKEHLTNTQHSTPTYSSSLPSENNSFSSPIVETFAQQQHQQQYQQQIFPQYQQRQHKTNGSIPGQIPITVPNRFSVSERFKKFDDANNSLRRNSYTKAIFYDNEKIY